MRFTNRALARRGSKRRVRAIRVRDHWSKDMTLLIAVLLGALAIVLYTAL